MIKSLFTAMLLMLNIAPINPSSMINYEVNNELVEETSPGQEVNPIEISQTKLSLELYSSVQLQVKVNTDIEEYKLTYESMDPNTVSVNDSGFVEALKVGKTQIVLRVTLSETTYEKIVEVDVYPIESTLTFEKESLNLTRGQNVDIKYTTSNPNIKNKDIVWSSSNPSVATVENSKIKAIKFGKTTITASIGDFKATMNVSVTVPLDKIEFNPNQVEIHIGNEMPIPDLIFVPFDTSVDRTIDYSSSDNDIVEIIDGNIVPKSLGEADIIAKVGEVEARLKVVVKARENEFGASVVQFELIESYEEKSVFGFNFKPLQSSNLIALNLPVKDTLDALDKGRDIEIVIPEELINNNFKKMDRLNVPSEVMQAIKDKPLNLILVNSKKELLAKYTISMSSPYAMNLKFSVKKISSSSELGMSVDGPSYELKFDQSIFPEATIVSLPSKTINSFPEAMHFIYHLGGSNTPDKGTLKTVKAGDTFDIELSTNRFLIAFNALSNSNDKVAITILSLSLVTILGAWGIFVFIKRNNKE